MATKNLGKKGIFLTFIAISIIAALIIIFRPSDLNVGEDSEAIKTRIANVNEYVSDLENVYLERTLHATGIKTINSLILYTEINGFFTDLPAFEANFKEVLLNGTIGEAPIDSITGQEIMKDNTYNDWLGNISIIAKDAFNVNTNFTVYDIKVYQIRPWFVNVDANVSFLVSSETALWDKNTTIRTEIGLEGFEDPYYLVNTGGAYSNRINKSKNLVYNEWRLENVTDHIRHGTYTHWELSEAPSFLMKFTGDTSPSPCCGIESLVNPNKLAALGLPSNLDVSYVDHLFWTMPEDCSNLYTVSEISAEFPNFKFDLNHLGTYNRTVEGQQLPCP